MRRLILPEHYDGSGSLLLSGKEARRLIKVLRLLPGDAFPALDVQGRQYICVIEKVDDGTVTLSVQPGEPTVDDSSKHYSDIRHTKRNLKNKGSACIVNHAGSKSNYACDAYSASSNPELVLAVGLLKGQKLDDVVRAGAELGFSTIQLLETERSVQRNTSSVKMIRYERIVKEALEQSGSAIVTKVHAPCTVTEFLEQYSVRESFCGFVFHEKKTGTGTMHGAIKECYQKFVLCVGPEGGFSDSELEQFMSYGFVPTWLGPSILRADTAAIAVMAIIKLLLVERESWQAK